MAKKLPFNRKKNRPLGSGGFQKVREREGRVSTNMTMQSQIEMYDRNDKGYSRRHQHYSTTATNSSMDGLHLSAAPQAETPEVDYREEKLHVQLITHINGMWMGTDREEEEERTAKCIMESPPGSPGPYSSSITQGWFMVSPSQP